MKTSLHRQCFPAGTTVPSQWHDSANRVAWLCQYAWDAYYDPIIKDFKARKLEGKELAEWKYQRYMHDYLSVIRSVDRNIGRVLNCKRSSRSLYVRISP